MADRDDGHGQEDPAENMEEEVEGDIGPGRAEGGVGGGDREQEVEAIEEDLPRGGQGLPPQGQGAPPMLVMDEEELPQELVLMEEVEIEESKPRKRFPCFAAFVYFLLLLGSIDISYKS